MTDEQRRDLALNIGRFANDMQFVCVSHCKRTLGIERTQFDAWIKWNARFDKFTNIFDKAYCKWNKHSRRY